MVTSSQPRDRDNDGWSWRNCAEEYGLAGWWYWDCGLSNLNGVYYHSPSTTDRTGIWWGHWHGWDYSLKVYLSLLRDNHAIFQFFR